LRGLVDYELTTNNETVATIIAGNTDACANRPYIYEAIRDSGFILSGVVTGFDVWDEPTIRTDSTFTCLNCGSIGNGSCFRDLDSTSTVIDVGYFHDGILDPTLADGRLPYVNLLPIYGIDSYTLCSGSRADRFRCY